MTDGATVASGAALAGAGIVDETAEDTGVDAGVNTTDPAAGDRWGRYGRRPLTLLALVALIDAVDRGILPGVLEKVQHDLGFSDARAGLLGTAFVLAGLLCTLPSGYLADRRPRTRIIAICLVSWGAISALNGLVVSYSQFLGVRAALGMGEAFNGPAAQSLTADFYPPAIRGRAYAIRGIAPIAGAALGTGLGGLVGALFGWRWAFVIVGIPGSALALAMWRLQEPKRGEHDAAPAPSVPDNVGATRKGFGGLRADVGRAWQVRSLRSLMVGTAISAGATAGLGFWAPTFYERHTSLSAGQAAGLTGGLILTGALAGAWLGGILSDRFRNRFEGAPMLVAGVAQVLGGLLLMSTFPDVPLWYRLPGQAVAVALIVGGFPALSTMIAEVVPGAIRGTAFSLTSVLSSAAAAASPLVIGVIADQFPFLAHGELKGNLARAFLLVSPLISVGGLVVLQGRRHVATDLARLASS